MAINSVLNSQKSPYLNWEDRPDSLKTSISIIFDRLVMSAKSAWNSFNGARFYTLCGVDEHVLMKKIIQQATKDKKDFYVLDIGAGNFEWSRSMADFIDQQTDLPKDIKVHIIGIRGERYLGDRIVETDRCKIYNLGAFKVEELFAQFKEMGLDLENKIDLAVSHWCFRHLVDPVGTAAQVYRLLRPGSGFFLVDGFFFLRNEENVLPFVGNGQMTQLFLDMKVPFLTKHHCGTRSLNHFMMRRPDETACKIPMSYSSHVHVDEDWKIGSSVMTRFKRERQEGDEENFHFPSNATEDNMYLYGDKKMFDWLKENELFCESNSVWQPLQKKDAHLGNPRLHRAVLQGNLDKLEECLEHGDDIDETNSSGQTALHIAIQKKALNLFNFLLQKGAHAGLYSREGNTPLHEAVLHDSEGLFLQALIDAGAELNAKLQYMSIPGTPLTLAIKAKNVKAVEMLIKAKAQLTAENYKNLQNTVFDSLHNKGIIPEEPTDAFNRALKWIRNGDCVVLHENGFTGMTYNYPNPSRPGQKLMIVNMNPDLNLLADYEWPSFLSLAGYQSHPYNKEEVVKGAFKETQYCRFGYETT
jgi:SAM-dependent methyltransferase